VASPFLTARWENLALVTYGIDESRLKKVMPPGCVADTRDGSAFVSLVAFDFMNTRVGGIRWPGFVDFPEINLRAYVRRGDTRGVVFVRELVPQALVAWMARTLYGEPYVAAPMESRVDHDEERIRVHHQFRLGGASHELEVIGDSTPRLPAADSTEHFFKEHDHGFGTDRRGRRIEYRVHHPLWRVYDVRSHRIDVDFRAAYGSEWAFLGESEPVSVVLAEGSGVAVHPGVVTGEA
jgi:uncharacterized protein YqjF (DUF2071 family)